MPVLPEIGLHVAAVERDLTEPILARVAAGEAAAVEECVARYGGLVWSLARRMLPVSEVEDAVQEVFIHIWRRADRYDPLAGREVTFVGTIARRRLIDFARSRGRRHEPVACSGSVEIGTVDPDHLERAEELRRLRDRWAELPSDERDVLGSAIYDGRTYSEIAEDLGIPLGTVKTRARRGLKRLKAGYNVHKTDTARFVGKGGG
ncbi:MAG: sigma-70 family RNA polymerase sigma factor [Planctomycetota bacterium]